MDNQAFLISETFVTDEIGQQIPKKTRKEIFVEEYSGTRQDQFDAGRDGLRVAYRLDTSMWDYDGEKIVEYKGVEYAIGRTYNRYDDEITELYLTEKVGLS